MSLQHHVDPQDAGTPRAPAPVPLGLPEPFDIKIRPARERVVVAPRGELDIATTERVAEAIDELVLAGFAEVVLDLRAVSFMDSTGLRLVLRQSPPGDPPLRLTPGAPP